MLIRKSNVVHAGTIQSVSKAYKQYAGRVAKTWCCQSGWHRQWHVHEVQEPIAVRAPYRLCLKCFPLENRRLWPKKKSLKKSRARVPSSTPCKR